MVRQVGTVSHKEALNTFNDTSSCEITVQHDSPQQISQNSITPSASSYTTADRSPAALSRHDDRITPNPQFSRPNPCYTVDIDHSQNRDSLSSSLSESLSVNRDASSNKKRFSLFHTPQLRRSCRTCTLSFYRKLNNYWGTIAFIIFQILGFAILGIFAFEKLSWQAWYSFAVLGATLVVLVANLLTPMLAMTLAVTALLAAKVITPDEAFAGLANEGILAVAIFFIVAEAVRQTAVLSPIFWFMLGRPKTSVEAHIRLIVPTTLVSSFFYNTPLVAILIPVVQAWSRRSGFPISRLLMPLNNAAALGGTLTLLGTSTNLVLDTLVKTSDILGPNVGFPIFGITPAGAVVAGAGLVFLALVSRFLRRERVQQTVGNVIQNSRKYVVALRVSARSPVVGSSLKDVGFQHLQGLFMIELTRANGTSIQGAKPETVIETGDTLLFAGVVETITELYHIRGFSPAISESDMLKLDRNDRRLVEVVVSKTSSMVGKRVSELAFGSRFSAAVIGLCGQGEFLNEDTGNAKICSSDRLLLETGKDFVSRFGKNENFDYVEEVAASQPPREDVFHMVIAGVIIVGMIVMATVGVLPLVTAAMLAAFLMVASGCVSVAQAGRSINWPVMITIAAGFGISNALKVTGAAAALGKFILRVCEPLGELGLLFGIYFGTALVTSLITSNAAVALMFPVIKEILDEQGDSITTNNKLRALYALMLGGSSLFATPIAFQTNMMVHGPGGYTFMDWVKFGVPLQVIVGTVGVLAIRALRFSV